MTGDDDTGPIRTDEDTGPTRTDDDPTPDGAEDDVPAVEEMLLSSGIVEETRDGRDLQLTDEFEAEWHGLNEQMRGSDRGLRWFAAARDVDPEEIDTEVGERRFALEIDGETVGEWPSEASFLAETVVRSLLREWLPEEEWERLSEDMHRELSARLLLFLERCPSCDGAVAFDEEVTDEVVRLSHTCTACGATLFQGAHE